MTQEFPLEEAAKRKTLLEAVEQIRDTLESNSEESEANRTLTQTSVDALYDSGLLRMKLPAVLGGAEADPVTQMDGCGGNAHPSICRLVLHDWRYQRGPARGVSA